MDQKGFRDLVTKYSEDEESKPRGGDLSFFANDSATVPKPIVEAAFKLKEVGDVAPPVKTDKGWAIIRLTQKRPGFNRPLAEVKRQIQQRLFRDLRSKAMDTFVDDLKKKSSITINDENLAKVVVEAGPGSPAAGNGLPGAPISPVGAPPPGTPAPRPVGMQPAGAPAGSNPPVKLRRVADSCSVALPVALALALAARRRRPRARGWSSGSPRSSATRWCWPARSRIGSGRSWPTSTGSPTRTSGRRGRRRCGARCWSGSSTTS